MPINHDLHGLGFERQVRFLPAIPSADECSCFGPTGLSKFLRHTGAGSFVWSSTVGDQPCLLREFQLVSLSDDVLGRHAD